MHRLSDVMQKRPWHPEMQRRYRFRTAVTTAVMVIVGSYLLYLSFMSFPPPEENPPQTVPELLDALRPPRAGASGWRGAGTLADTTAPQGTTVATYLLIWPADCIFFRTAATHRGFSRG